jgi:hypothetical protein
MTTWKQLFGEPIVVLSAIQAVLQTVNWVALNNTTVQIIVSALLAIVGVLTARARVTPVRAAAPVASTPEHPPPPAAHAPEKAPPPPPRKRKK